MPRALAKPCSPTRCTRCPPANAPTKPPPPPPKAPPPRAPANPGPPPARPRRRGARGATGPGPAPPRAAQVQMFGRIGDDAHGRILRARLDADGIDHSGVQTDPNADTGMAAI